MHTYIFTKLLCMHVCMWCDYSQDIVSVSLVALCLRVLSNNKPTSDILQMMGIIAQLEDMKLVPYVDECIWR